MAGFPMPTISTQAGPTSLRSCRMRPGRRLAATDVRCLCFGGIAGRGRCVALDVSRTLLNIPMLGRVCRTIRTQCRGALSGIGRIYPGRTDGCSRDGLIAVTVLAFGPILGFFYALIGMTASALLTFGIGHLLGRQSIRRLAGSRLNHLSRRLAQKGVLAVIVIRIMPSRPLRS